MLLLWKENIPYWKVGLAYALLGIGVGLAGPPHRTALTGSVPVAARRHGVRHGRPAARPRRRDHAVDLRRPPHRGLRGGRGDGGGRGSNSVNSSVEAELTKSFSSAADLAKQYPSYATQIIEGAKAAFLHGDQWAYTAGIIAVLAGLVLVFFLFPGKQQELDLLARYHGQAASEQAVSSPPRAAHPN